MKKSGIILQSKNIVIIKRNNWQFLLSELPSFFCNRKKNLGCIKRHVKKKDFCNVIMPSEDTKILEFSHIKNLIKHILSV